MRRRSPSWARLRPRPPQQPSEAFELPQEGYDLLLAVESFLSAHRRGWRPHRIPFRGGYPLIVAVRRLMDLLEATSSERLRYRLTVGVLGLVDYVRDVGAEEMPNDLLGTERVARMRATLETLSASARRRRQRPRSSRSPPHAG